MIRTKRKSDLLEWFEHKAEEAFGELMYSCVSGNWYCSMEDPAAEVEGPDRSIFLCVSGSSLEQVLEKMYQLYEIRLDLLTPDELNQLHSVGFKKVG